MPTLPRGDRGSLLLLQAFFISAVLAAVVVVADVAAVIGARQQLAATADQAALAGAQAVDMTAYYRTGAAGLAGPALDPASVAAAVRRYLAPAIAAEQQPALAVREIAVRDASVSVVLTASAALPFTSSLGLSAVPVRASATARLAVQPVG
jgi:hypothetical protein